MDMTPLLNAKQVAAILNVGLMEVYTLADEGKLPKYKFGRRNVRFHPADVQAYIEAARVESKPIDWQAEQEIPY